MNKLIFSAITILPVMQNLYSQKAGSATNSNEPESTRPNIIFIMSDDHDLSAISAYNGKLNKTPNIDRIAQEGMLFRKCFVSNSISGPSRAVLLTGKHSNLNGFTDNMNCRFDSSQQTYPKLFQTAGYQTAMIGKWHLESHPTGYDYWNILPDQGKYYQPDFIDNGKAVQYPGYVTDITTNLALDWLSNRDKSKPFMLNLHHKAPHREWDPNLKDLTLYDSIDIPEPESLFDDYTGRGRAAHEQEMTILNHMSAEGDLKMQPNVAKEMNVPGNLDNSLSVYEARLKGFTPEQRVVWENYYKNRDEKFILQNPKGKDLLKWKYQQYIKDYLRCVHSVDENVGRLLRYLDSTGLAKNTIIIYASDQGFYLGDHGWYDKRFMYEESMSTPFIVKWPGVTNGTESTQMVQNIDWAETLLDIAGIKIPNDMQGLSLTPLLKGEKPQNWRKELYYHYYEFPKWHHVYPHLGMRTEKFKLIYFYTINEWELYDLINDPNELNNLSAKVEYANTFADLKVRLKELQKKYKDSEVVIK